MEFLELNGLDAMIQDYDFLHNPDKTEDLIKSFMKEYNRMVMVNPNKGKFSLTVLDAHFGKRKLITYGYGVFFRR